MSGLNRPKKDIRLTFSKEDGVPFYDQLNSHPKKDARNVWFPKATSDFPWSRNKFINK